MQNKLGDTQPYTTISVTGTKGKTSLVRIIDYIFINLKKETLRVDSDGHYVNGLQKSNMADTKTYWGVDPASIAPGRYLYELMHFKDIENSIAIFESAIGCSAPLRGLGYGYHDIGIFTNIYRDHINNKRIKNKNDIYKAKRFVLSRIKKTGGTFIFNADDEFLLKKISKELLPSKTNIIGFGSAKSFQNFKDSGFSKCPYIEYTSNALFYRKNTTRKKLLSLLDVPITFNGSFLPGVYTIATAVSVVLSKNGITWLLKEKGLLTKILKKYQPDQYGGRITFIKKAKKPQILIDFAHEAESLWHIAQLAKKRSGGKVIGVLRIDPIRTKDEIEVTAKKIAKSYDNFIIYDKIDGITIKKSRHLSEGRYRLVGETAKLFQKYLKKHGAKNVSIILNEEQALSHAVEKNCDQDVIVYIGNGNDHKKTYLSAKNTLTD